LIHPVNKKSYFNIAQQRDAMRNQKSNKTSDEMQTYHPIVINKVLQPIIVGKLATSSSINIKRKEVADSET
jgi:hypothetical protein